MPVEQEVKINTADKKTSNFFIVLNNWSKVRNLLGRVFRSASDLESNVLDMNYFRYNPLITLLLVTLVFSCERDDVDENPIIVDDQTRNSGLVARYLVDGDNLTLVQNGPASVGFFNETRQNEFWSFLRS